MPTFESYDIFDTVLVRILGSPTSVFLLLGKALHTAGLIAVSAQEFTSMRVNAEKQARLRKESREVSLEEIYADIRAALQWTEIQTIAARELECRLEQLVLRPVPGMKQELETVRTRQQAVIFLSDMYLSGETIRGFLQQHGLWRPNDKLLVSCDLGVSKASGDLFAKVLDTEGISPKALCHHGNDSWNDVSKPLSMGIKVQPFPAGNLNRYETLLEQHAASTGALSSALAGASRLARLAQRAEAPENQTLRDIAASVVAPALLSYVIWLLRRAQTEGIRRLYFVSRDGQILLQIARVLAPKLGVTCELRYLYSSRQSWHLPGITELDVKRLDWLFLKYDFLSIRSLLFRVGLSPTAIRGELAQFGFTPEGWDRSLTPEEVERAKAVFNLASVGTLVEESAREQRERVLRYLTQEDLLSSEPWALVDVGWNGRPQASLGRILATVGAAPPRGFYFALASVPSSPTAGRFEAYLFDPSDQRFRNVLNDVDLSTFLEIACAADHGTVEGYRDDPGGTVVPVLRSPTNLTAQSWGLATVQATTVQVAQELCLVDGLVDGHADVRHAVMAVMKAFWTSPSREDARVFGAFEFENDQSGTSRYPIAEAFSIRDVCRTVIRGRIPSRHLCCWHAGSVAISPGPIRKFLRLSSALKRRLHSGGQRSAASDPARNQT